MSADDGPDELEVEPVDVDDMIRSNRLRSLFGARDKLREVRTDGVIESTNGRAMDTGPSAYRTAIESYVREAEALFSQTEAGQQYWSEHDFGSFDVVNFGSCRSPEGGKYRVPGTEKTVFEIPDGNRVQVVGLKSLFELSSPVPLEFEVSVPSKRRGKGQTPKRTVEHREIPFRILDGMVAATHGYLAEIGLDIEVSDGPQQTKVDDDLISEVEQWRRDNL